MDAAQTTIFLELVFISFNVHATTIAVKMRFILLQSVHTLLFWTQGYL